MFRERWDTVGERRADLEPVRGGEGAVVAAAGRAAVEFERSIPRVRFQPRAADAVADLSSAFNRASVPKDYALLREVLRRLRKSGGQLSFVCEYGASGCVEVLEHAGKFPALPARRRRHDRAARFDATREAVPRRPCFRTDMKPRRRRAEAGTAERVTRGVVAEKRYDGQPTGDTTRRSRRGGAVEFVGCFLDRR